MIMSHSHHTHESSQTSYATRSVFEPSKVFAPVSYFHPTTRYHPFHRVGAPRAPQSRSLDGQISFKWTSRNNRKGRHELSITQGACDSAPEAPEPTATARQTARGIKRMFTEFPVWDISYNIAILFVVGSIVFIINGVLALVAAIMPDQISENLARYGGSITGIIGGAVFQMGVMLMLLEAVNEKKEDCFGWELKRAFTRVGVPGQYDCEKGNGWKLKPVKSCFHYHTNRRRLISRDERGSSGIEQGDSPPPSSEVVDAQKDRGGRRDQDTWCWFPTWHSLITHYIYEIGFLGCVVQYVSTIVFWVSAFVFLPGIYNRLSGNLQFALYTVPQAIGCAGFIFSGLLFTIETQRKWYLPAFSVLGWYIGMLSCIGGIGFTASAMLPFTEAKWADEQAAITTIWASFTFLVASLIQWYESLDKHPVEVVKQS